MLEETIEIIMVYDKTERMYLLHCALRMGGVTVESDRVLSNPEWRLETTAENPNAFHLKVKL